MQELVSRVVEVLTDLVQSIYGGVRGDPSYRSGFISAVLVMLATGAVLRKMRTWWDKALKPFRSTDDDGPSPVRTLLEAISALAKLVFVLGVIFLVASLVGAGGN